MLSVLDPRRMTMRISVMFERWTPMYPDIDQQGPPLLRCGTGRTSPWVSTCLGRSRVVGSRGFGPSPRLRRLQIGLLEEQRDRHLRRAVAVLRRLNTELEAVRNDITEAREYPQQ